MVLRVALAVVSLGITVAAKDGVAQDLKGPAKKSYELDISAGKQWTDSGIDVLSGTRLAVSATGTVQFEQAPAAGPDGLTRGWKDLLRVLPVNNGGRGALLGRIGNVEYSPAFLIGSQKEVRCTGPGRLFLGVNEESDGSATGSFHVTIQVLEVGSATAPDLATSAADPTKLNSKIPGVDAALFEKVPRRIQDEAGDPGDMVNFLIIGTEEQMKQAFSNAGWVIVDKTKKAAVLHGLVSSLTKQSYVEVPMSELFLFGRSQDYGFAHAEPFQVVETRHHLRVWKAPFEVNGQTLWIGAATHDIGIERDQRNNGITHKIDPNVDDERKYVAQTLAETGVIKQVGYFRPEHPLTEAKTATGGGFHSDGNVLILVCGQQ
ncbi:MAG: LssY C-terminal domain-containing protein [Acidobacteriaceae bacterium]|nr:LssY C-terminal domain-containing protein [Acidobacteriaceae bacterium]